MLHKCSTDETHLIRPQYSSYLPRKVIRLAVEEYVKRGSFVFSLAAFFHAVFHPQLLD